MGCPSLQRLYRFFEKCAVHAANAQWFLMPCSSSVNIFRTRNSFSCVILFCLYQMCNVRFYMTWCILGSVYVQNFTFSYKDFTIFLPHWGLFKCLLSIWKWRVSKDLGDLNPVWKWQTLMLRRSRDIDFWSCRAAVPWRGIGDNSPGKKHSP